MKAQWIMHTNKQCHIHLKSQVDFYKMETQLEILLKISHIYLKVTFITVKIQQYDLYFYEFL